MKHSPTPTDEEYSKVSSQLADGVIRLTKQRDALVALLEALNDHFGDNCFCDVDGLGNHAPECPRIKAEAALRAGEQA